MTSDFQVSETYKKNKEIPKSVIEAERDLRYNYGSFWYSFSGYRNSRNIDDLYGMHNWCDVHRINWLDIQPFILKFINCKVDDQPKKSFTKKLRENTHKKHAMVNNNLFE